MEAILCDVPSVGTTDFDRLASICEMSVGMDHDHCSDIVSHRSVIMSSLDRGVFWFTSAQLTRYPVRRVAINVQPTASAAMRNGVFAAGAPLIEFEGVSS